MSAQTHPAVVSKAITAQRYTFMEHRGHGAPSAFQSLDAESGDVFIDTRTPHHIWYRNGSSWIEWTSMRDSDNHPHPQRPLILLPLHNRMSWVPAEGFKGYYKNVKDRLGSREDSANIHAGLILFHSPTPGIAFNNLQEREETSSDAMDVDDVNEIMNNFIDGASSDSHSTVSREIENEHQENIAVILDNPDVQPSPSSTHSTSICSINTSGSEEGMEQQDHIVDEMGSPILDTKPYEQHRQLPSLSDSVRERKAAMKESNKLIYEAVQQAPGK